MKLAALAALLFVTVASAQKKKINGNTCTKMQLCINDEVQKAWGRMHKQIASFVDAAGECSAEVREMHATLAEHLAVDRTHFVAIANKVERNMRPRMELADDYIEECMVARGHKDGVDYCADWRAFPAAKGTFSSVPACDKLGGADFERAMNNCMANFSNIFVEGESAVYSDLRACQAQPIPEIPLDNSSSSDSSSEEAPARRKRSASEGAGKSVEEFENALGLELMTTVLQKSFDRKNNQDDVDDDED